MGWGGGGGMYGGFGGGHPGASQTGLPFGGIPTELMDGVNKIVATEPEHAPSDIKFTQLPSEAERRPLTLWDAITAYPRMLITGSALVAVVTACLVAGPLLTEYAINHGMAFQVGKHWVGGHLSIILWCAGAYVAISAFGAIMQRFQVNVTGRLASRVMHDLRIRVFTHLQRLSLDFFTDEKAGVLMSRMTSDIENLQQLVQDGISSFAVQGLQMIVMVIVMFVISPVLAFWTLVLILPVLFVLTVWFHHHSTRGYLRARDGIAGVLSDLSESLYGIRVVTAHNRQKRNIRNHRHVIGWYRDANLYTGRVNALYGPFTVMIGILGQALLLGIGGNEMLHGELTLGALSVFFQFLNRFIAPIQLLVQQYNLLQQGRSSITRLSELLATPPSVDEKPDALVMPPIEGRLVFDDVSFGYDPAQPVLHNVSLTIEPGESVAFVGPTGAGKSTMAKLATRFYDPTAGRILLDGIDLRDVTLRSLRSQLGVVPQEPYLFSGSIRQNLSFGRQGITEAEIEEAVDVVGLRDLVDRLPNGLDTIVHERGQTLSAGERQLLALARAFLARPRVLVLDEATSSLDLKSETVVERALDAVLEGRTAILIAHRLTTAQRADRIVVIDHGEVVEMGTPAELVRREGVYARMFAAWLDSGGRDASRVTPAD